MCQKADSPATRAICQAGDSPSIFFQGIGNFLIRIFNPAVGDAHSGIRFEPCLDWAYPNQGRPLLSRQSMKAVGLGILNSVVFIFQLCGDFRLAFLRFG